MANTFALLAAFALLLSLQYTPVYANPLSAKLSNLPANTCGSTQVFTPSSFSTFPINEDNAVFDISFIIKDECSVSLPFDLFTVSINVGGTQTAIAKFELGTDKKVYAYYKSPTRTYAARSTPAAITTYTNTLLRISLTIAFIDQLISAFVYTLNNEESSLQRYPSFGAWRLDSTTKIHICSKMDGTSSVSCEVKSFLVTSVQSSEPYFQISEKLEIHYGLNPSLIASYPLGDISGSKSVKDVVGGIGDMYLGASTSTTLDSTTSPVLSGSDLAFSAATQYLQLPSFNLASGDFGTTVSLTMSFYLQLTSSNAGCIFRYSRSDLSSDFAQLRIEASGELSTWIDSISTLNPGSTTLTLNTWYLITVSLGYSTSGTSVAFFKTSINGLYEVASAKATGFSIPNGAIIQFGGPSGFQGKIRSLQVFSPGSLITNSPTYSNDTTNLCAIDLAFGNPPLCLSCSNGTYFYQGKCTACPAGTAVWGDYCKDCNLVVENCVSCDTTTFTCSACKSGYELASPTSCRISTGSGTSNTKSAKLTAGHIVGIAIGSVAFMAIFTLAIVFVSKKRRILGSQKVVAISPV